MHSVRDCKNDYKLSRTDEEEVVLGMYMTRRNVMSQTPFLCHLGTFAYAFKFPF